MQRYDERKIEVTNEKMMFKVIFEQNIQGFVLYKIEHSKDKAPGQGVLCFIPFKNLQIPTANSDIPLLQNVG